MPFILTHEVLQVNRQGLCFTNFESVKLIHFRIHSALYHNLPNTLKGI
jgi:hypothetical protein